MKTSTKKELLGIVADLIDITFTLVLMIVYGWFLHRILSWFKISLSTWQCTLIWYVLVNLLNWEGFPRGKNKNA